MNDHIDEIKYTQENMIPNHGYSQSHDYLTGFDGCRSKYRPNLMAADL